MNSKQRVQTALRRSGLPDRVPLQFDLCRPLLEAFSDKYGVPLHYSPAYYEDVTYRLSGNELRVAMGADCVVVGAGLPAGYQHPKNPDGTITNEFGMKMRQGFLYMDVLDGPFANITSAEEVRAFPFPDPDDPGRYDDAKKYIEKYRDEYFIIGDVELTMFELAWHMVGMEKFMIDLAAREPYVDVLLDRCKEFSLKVARNLAALGVDGIWTGDDFGSQTGMMVSPRLWRSVFKPRFAEIFQEIRAANPDTLVMYHCDGAIAPILPDLIEIGMQVFNPVQPNVPGHDPQELKSRFGDQLSFWGAVDQQSLLPNGTPEEIEADVAEKIRVLGEGGGYLCAPAHILQSDTPLENIESFIQAVKKHGVYA
jgi:uroporphyrinogen decarboxylase